MVMLKDARHCLKQMFDIFALKHVHMIVMIMGVQVICAAIKLLAYSDLGSSLWYFWIFV